MDADRFDSLTRSLTRRSLGLFATLGLAGLAAPNTAVAKKKKPCSACKKRKKGKCKANQPNGTSCPGGACQSGSCVTDAPCVPQDPVAVCAGGCGARTDNCGRTVVCATCPTGQTCLLNGSCAMTCFQTAQCPTGCDCGYGTTEGLAQRCVQIPPELTCADLQSCTSTAQCPRGNVCLYTNCGAGGMDDPRCVPLCPCASCPAETTCQSSGTCAA